MDIPTRKTIGPCNYGYIIDQMMQTSSIDCSNTEHTSWPLSLFSNQLCVLFFWWDLSVEWPIWFVAVPTPENVLFCMSKFAEASRHTLSNSLLSCSLNSLQLNGSQSPTQVACLCCLSVLVSLIYVWHFSAVPLTGLLQLSKTFEHLIQLRFRSENTLEKGYGSICRGSMRWGIVFEHLRQFDFLFVISWLTFSSDYISWKD